MAAIDQTSIEITGIRVRRLVVPLRRPLATRIGLFDKAPFLAIDLDLKGGGEGRLLAFSFAKIGLDLVPPVLDELTNAAIGRKISLASLPAFHDECQRKFSLLGHEGVVQLALSIFDMVIHDALAREAGVPLYKFLGGRREPIAAYIASGPGLHPPQEAASKASEILAADGGYKQIKMRLGRDTIEEDVQAIRAVREAIGPDAMLSVDFNQGLPEHHALACCRAVDDLGLTWIEEPVIYDNYDLQAQLTRKLSTPIQIGENWWSWRVGKMAIEKAACDYIMPDILRIGGVTGWRRLADIAAMRAIPFSSHQSADYSVHVLAATQTAHWLEYMDWGQDLLQDPMIPEAGFALPREAPGAGMEWNQKAVDAVTID